MGAWRVLTVGHLGMVLKGVFSLLHACPTHWQEIEAFVENTLPLGCASKKVLGSIPSLGPFCAELITLPGDSTSSRLGCEPSFLWLHVIGRISNWHGCHLMTLSYILADLN